ncbi:MAG: hypothetical protein AW11_02494 [Candidatus Accumulibacter regalis]|jgi:Uncharacterized protein conserved in bacteria|uniref:FIST C-domain domain-containing protein n=1 Tax=Accumulibacter regalis TaxID=522306 RepID=A0A011QEV5_ACCRE|nr:FIST C-terminal domain-containing protein [Accumulibacter sp.]EXI87630.1 MAG: hypothetical protein AW11_02494 [Candidatus Accumulibacter regalis]MBL8367571.1 FIST C-terminal domain-containing protein [Accumulibacter sp.]MBN8512803.1 FIST C-terminal domain-containing protein [Accumulibacter sp.]MBO3703358.1 FIST C-terminal domain-containing protein [Accumulibacter sp.]HRE69657.1 FIST C-terminal domain-containing protein [Accumulibacter sp.]
MSVASALVSGNDALPALAEEALAKALARSGASHATGVLLFLTPDFSRCAQQTVSAVARAAQCTEVAGGIAAGVFSEHGWVIDRPAAAVMVFAGGLSLDHREGGAPAGEAHREAFMSYAGGSFPYPWGDATKRRFGGSFAGSTGGSAPTVWQHSRLAASCSVRVHGARVDIGVSSGWSLLAEPRRIERSRAYDLLSLGGESALDSLLGALPADLREQGPPPLAALSALLIDEESGANRDAFSAAGRHSIAILSANAADRSLTLAEGTRPGQRLAWAIRRPQSAEDDMRRSVEQLAAVVAEPVAGLVFSCIGRGPYFHGAHEPELDCLRRAFPGLPLLGVYGTGQIAACAAGGNRSLHNAVVTALISNSPRRSSVQSQS